MDDTLDRLGKERIYWTKRGPVAASAGWLWQYEVTGDKTTLKDAAEIMRRASKSQPLNIKFISQLCSGLQARYEHFGAAEDAEEVLSLSRRALSLELCEEERLSVLVNLASILQVRFNRLGGLHDLEDLISVWRTVVELTTDENPCKPLDLDNLASALSTRFHHVGEFKDLEAAISLKRIAVDLTLDENPIKPYLSSSLGSELLSRYERVGERQDLDEAILLREHAVDNMRHGDHNNRALLQGLSEALLARFELDGQLEDVDSAISATCRALDLTPNGHSQKRSLFSSLGRALFIRFERTLQLEDLLAARSLLRRAVKLTPDEDSSKSNRLQYLGLTIRAYLECALQGSWHRRQTLLELFHEARTCFINAITCPSGSPATRFRCAQDVVTMSIMYNDFATTASLLEAHSHVMRVLPELVWLGHTLDRRYEESSGRAFAVYEAVSTAIQHGALSRAVEWLETGRSIVWSQLLGLRTPLDELEMHQPELFKQFQVVRRQLQNTAHLLRSDDSHVADGRASVTTLPSDTALDLHRKASIKHDRILSTIRGCPGFENFLLPKPFSALSKSLGTFQGYFVYLNVHESLCNALVLAPFSDPLSIPLPALSQHRASVLRSMWACRLRTDGRVLIRGMSKNNAESSTSPGRLLRFMWEWIVCPVLSTLNIVNSGDRTPLPHITWCPTGPLAQLPLHAAGDYSTLDGPRLFNYVVSSYAPSLSAIAHASEGLAKQRFTATSSVLVVTQPATPGQPPLPGTLAEERQLRKILDARRMQYDVLDHEQATQEAIRTVMRRRSWVHLACHGSQHSSNPAKSAFHLYDGPFSLIDLMQTVADDAELAFLSACQTATGDEQNPEEAVHLAAGMLAVGFKGVVATMWSIGDADAPIIVEAYYKKLLSLRRSGTLGKGETGAAYALHEAVKVLREHVGEKNFLSWAPFVHFGV